MLLNFRKFISGIKTYKKKNFVWGLPTKPEVGIRKRVGNLQLLQGPIKIYKNAWKIFKNRRNIQGQKHISALAPKPEVAQGKRDQSAVAGHEAYKSRNFGQDLT